MQRHTTICITKEKGAGVPVLDYLTSRFTYLDRDGWRNALAAGQLLVNGRSATAEERLAVDDRIVFSPPPYREPAVNGAYSILHEDEDLLVLDKPGGLPCHPRGRYFTNTLWALLKKRFPGQYLSLVNRLDRETSGIVLVAKNRAAAAACQQQFIARTVPKKYLAIIRGTMPENLAAAGFIGKDISSPIRHKMRFSPGTATQEGAGAGKSCRTSFTRLHHDKDLSLIEAVPHGGRQHQIRATLEALGLAIVGDKIYGGDAALFLRFVENRLSAADRAFLLLPRQALHAAALTLRHPRTGEEMTFRAPLPPDMAGLFPDWRPDARHEAPAP